MGNMSYCRFQNTLLDLQDCYHSMDEELDKHGEEQSAKAALIELCQSIADEYGEED